MGIGIPYRPIRLLHHLHLLLVQGFFFFTLVLLTYIPPFPVHIFDANSNQEVTVHPSLVRSFRLLSVNCSSKGRRWKKKTVFKLALLG